MTLRCRSLALFALLSLTAGCASNELLLTVDLRTDFQPVAEFSVVETELRVEGATGGAAQIVRRSVSASDDFLAGGRVAEVPVGEAGAYLLTTTLRDAAGARVGSRTTRVTLDASLALTMLLTRSCAGVSCPGALDDPNATSCLGGRCVDPECATDGAAGCGEPECASDADCAPEPACARATCAEGYCLQSPDDAACGPGLRCTLASGCEEAPPEVDAGPVETDAGVSCTPSVEACNERDDDCDGRVDETFDRSSDESNCGTCGNACGSWQRCGAGACVLDESRLSATYCPSDTVTRGTAAVFLVRAQHGADYEPPPAVGVFDDVPTSGVHARYIEQLYRDGIVNGCTATTFCPNTDVTRGQMALMLVRTAYGASYVPPDATGVFDDVPPGGVFAPYIEQLYRDGVVNGCTATTYCPSDPVTRGQMAIFLLRSEHGGSYAPPPATGDLFDDVPAGGFYSAWIEQLAREGITTGC